MGGAIYICITVQCCVSRVFIDRCTNLCKAKTLNAEDCNPVYATTVIQDIPEYIKNYIPGVVSYYFKKWICYRISGDDDVTVRTTKRERSLK